MVNRSFIRSQLQRQLLSEFLQISHNIVKFNLDVEDELNRKRQERLREIRETLRVFTYPICRDRLCINSIPLEIRCCFVRAVLLITRYPQLGGSAWQGTLFSSTLNQYRPDPIPADLLSKNSIEKLCKSFDIPNAFHIECEKMLQNVDCQITQKKRLIKAVLADAASASSLDTLGNLPPSALVSLFKNLFGQIPIPAAAIKYVHTEMQIFFCVSYQDGQLCEPRLLESLSEKERSDIQAFLLSLDKFSFDLFRNFPVFTLCNASRINYHWCAHIAQRAGLTTAEVIQTLPQCVGIIPTYKAEAFLVHDIWGHHWQAILTQFKADYVILANCNQPIRSTTTAYNTQEPLTCKELFTLEGEQVKLDETRASLFFHAEVQQRLGLLFTHLIGEMLADIAEFKLIWDHPQSVDQLLSSSIFKEEPTKLDLTLNDLNYLFLRVLQPLLEIHLSAVEDSVLEMDILADWAAIGHLTHFLELRNSLKQEIVHLGQIFFREYSNTYLPTMADDTGAFALIVRNLLYLQNTLNSLYTDQISRSEFLSMPFSDLLLIFVGYYCSNDNYNNFWKVGNVIANYFRPCCQLLMQSRLNSSFMVSTR